MNDRTRRMDRGPRNQSNGERDDRPPLSREEVQAILGNGVQEIDAAARKIAQQCSGLPRTQMRNFYGPIVRLRNELAADPNADLSRRHARELMMHRARLVYMAARNGAAGPLQKSFADLVGDAIRDNHAEREKVAAICDFAEAVVA